MKKLVFYFDPRVKKIFEQHESENGEKKTVLSSPHNFVSAGEIVARAIEINEEYGETAETKLDTGYTYYHVVNFIQVKVGEGIYYDQNLGAYKSSAYGFIILHENKLRLLTTLNISKDKITAYFFIHPTKFRKIPNYQDISEWSRNFEIMALRTEVDLGDDLAKINVKENHLTRLIIAQGKKPVNEREEYYEPLIDVNKKAGEILEDGRIDFKETGSIIQVIKDQELLRRIPERKPVDGYDIYGNKVAAVLDPPKGFKCGTNIVQSGHDENIFLAGISGCIHIDRRDFSVLPVAVINGDVNYDSGNIDFDGSVHVHGSVLAGFIVKATGAVIIEKNVDDATIIAGGDITVKNGVTGKEHALIESGGLITAKYFLNAKVEAIDEITVEDSIINCNVFSNKKVSVVSKHGKIIGGKTTALYEVEVKVAGAVNETETVLSVGRNLVIEKELLEVQKEMKKWKEDVTETMRKLKVNFGEAVFDNPKEYLQILPDVKKRNCLLLLQELSKGNKELKKYSDETKKIQEKLKLEKEPYIVVKDKIYPGTVLNIKKSVRKIDKPLENVKFFEDPVDKIIRFTSAV